MTNEVSHQTAKQFQQSVIYPLKQQVTNYRNEFESAFKEYMIENSMLAQMESTLHPEKNQRNKKIENFSSKYYKNNKQSTQHLIRTMLKGHELLLEIRERLTGQTITTKFIIQSKGEMYAIDSSQLDMMNLALSKYGGGTISNPFSLAYSLSEEMGNLASLLNDDNKITKKDIWQQIWDAKDRYFDLKQNEHNDPNRQYKKFYDSKDAEIYERYVQQTENDFELTGEKYYKLRQDIGKSNTTFYKMGDVGSVQIKFFNLDARRNSLVNFTRFSLLRDKLRRLEQILSEDLATMSTDLINFFTEKENKITDSASAFFNEEVKTAILNLFRPFT